MDSKPDHVMTALSTPEVREMILRKLDSRSLLNCRLVCHSWNTTASSILRKMPAWIKRSWNSDNFLLLHNCMSSSMGFPFTGLNLSLGQSSSHWGVDGRNTVKFFSKFGKHFTHVRISMTYRWHSKIVKILLSNTPNLHFLDIGDSLDCFEGEGVEFRLPALRILHVKDWRGTRSLLKEVILGAPHLEKVEQVDCSTWIQLEGIVKDRNLSSLVSSMTLTSSHEYDTLYSDLGNNPLQLTELRVSHNGDSPSFRAALKIILMKSRNTLKKIQFQGFHRNLEELTVFHNVEELDFTVTAESLAENADVSAVFPNLSKICFPNPLGTIVYPFSTRFACTEDCTQGCS